MIYFMKAACKSAEINVFMLDKLYLSKDVVALVVVFSDIAIGFILFIMFQYLRGLQYITNDEIDGSTLTASDLAL